MTSIGIARPPPLFSLGFDILGPVSGAMVQDAKLAGYKWIGRYLHNLTAQEVSLIFAQKMGLWLLTYAPTNVVLTASTGVQYGGQAVHQARSLSVPPSVDITADYESPMAGSDGPAHLTGFWQQLVGNSYGDCLYVGGPEDLNAGQLMALPFTGYAKGGGEVPEPSCGWKVLQLEPLEGVTFGGVKCDADVCKADYKGRQVTMWWGA